ncbi:hypothetical protein L484_025547 [Morus notabilis]|uniref:Uncharacterized protein n=2 Tax=Morus notabilis TaxID=981085 RepID=W9RP64_9ROSA|nr:hypothetical protein L484_025547 [Morus notabilis]
MDKKKEFERLEAQKIERSDDLALQLNNSNNFVAAIDRNWYLYGGPALERDIHQLVTTQTVSLYGKILDNRNVISSVQKTCKKQMEKIWNRVNPNEAYELLLLRHPEKSLKLQKAPKLIYSRLPKGELLSFTSMKPITPTGIQTHMNDNLDVEGAVARFKGVFAHDQEKQGEVYKEILCANVITLG